MPGQNAITPPILVVASISVTASPCRAAATAAPNPAVPPPITSTSVRSRCMAVRSAPVVADPLWSPGPTLPAPVPRVKRGSPGHDSCLGLLLPPARCLGPVLRGTARAGERAPLPARGLLGGLVIAVEKDADPLQRLHLVGHHLGPVHRHHADRAVGSLRPGRQQHGLQRVMRAARAAMRQKAVLGPLPQPQVELVHPRRVGPAHGDAPARRQRLVQQQRQGGLKRALRQVIEIGCAHQAYSNRSRTSRSSVSTPQPLAPSGAWTLSDLTLAIPAMSRCTQGVPSSMKRCRNSAAVIVPAGPSPSARAALSTASHSASSFDSAAAFSWPSAMIAAPVRVARSMMALGL